MRLPCDRKGKKFEILRRCCIFVVVHYNIKPNIKMKEEIQAKIYEATKDITYPELRVYLGNEMKYSALYQQLVTRGCARNQNKRHVNSCI
jgi:hypothetical protein